MTRRMVIMLLCFVLVVAGLGLYKTMQIKAMIKKFAAMKPPPVPVSVIGLQPAQWQSRAATVGSLRAVHGVDISSEIAGLATAVPMHSGQQVHRGQVLVQLNDAEERAQSDALKAAADLARINLDRDRKQLLAHAVAQAVVDADLADLSGKLAQLHAQEALVAKKAIRAPFEGRLGVVTVNPGQYVNPGDKLASLQTTDPVLVDFSVPQSVVPQLHVDGQVKVLVDSAPGQDFSARITALDSKIDTVTRNIMVEASVASHGGLLMPGMFARVKVDTGDIQNYLTLPQTAVVYHPYGDVVFVAEGTTSQGGHAKVHQVFVNLGPVRGDQVAVLSGLSAGQMVVTSGGQLLKNDDEVVIDNRHAPSMDAHPETPNDE